MKALTQKGYEVNYSWGMNMHGQKFGEAIIPEMTLVMARWTGIHQSERHGGAGIPPTGRQEELGAGYVPSIEFA